MNKIKNILAVLLLSLVLVNCDPGDFGNINDDPNNPVDVDTRFLFVNSAMSLSRYLPGGYNSWQALYPQYAGEWSNIQFTKFTLLDYTLGTSLYAIALRDLNTIIDLNTKEETKATSAVMAFGSNSNQIAIARILRAFYYSHMTDALGMIPYSEALKGKNGFFPKYDTQESIYADLDKELKEAVGQFDGGAMSSQYDILYHGNIDNWKRMANSLRMILALRLSKVDPSTGKVRFQDALSHGAGYIESNIHNFVYKYTNEDATANPLYSNIVIEGRDDYTPTEKIVDIMSDMNDPRMEDYFQKNKDGNYVGVPFGITNAETADWPRDRLSRFGVEFIKKDAPGVLISAAYVKLTIAEAAERGWISKSAEDFYKEGIKMSVIQRHKYDAVQPVLDTYFSETSVAYTGSTDEKLEKIALQKWLANYMQDGMEAFSEWRRTGVPELSPGSMSEIPEIPRRFKYASDDYVANQEAYEAAIQTQGPDEETTRIWWDKK